MDLMTKQHQRLRGLNWILMLICLSSGGTHLWLRRLERRLVFQLLHQTRSQCSVQLWMQRCSMIVHTVGMNLFYWCWMRFMFRAWRTEEQFDTAFCDARGRCDCWWYAKNTNDGSDCHKPFDSCWIDRLLESSVLAGCIFLLSTKLAKLLQLPNQRMHISWLRRHGTLIVSAMQLMKRLCVTVMERLRWIHPRLYTLCHLFKRMTGAHLRLV